jgi:hypothetical protein
VFYFIEVSELVMYERPEISSAEGSILSSLSAWCISAEEVTD